MISDTAPAPDTIVVQNPSPTFTFDSATGEYTIKGTIKNWDGKPSESGKLSKLVFMPFTRLMGVNSPSGKPVAVQLNISLDNR